LAKSFKDAKNAILASMLLIVFVGAFLTEREWLAEILEVLISAFVIIAGIAVGKSAGKSEYQESQRGRASSVAQANQDTGLDDQ